ncbi:MAG: threonine-phosphate decarboxylase [Nitrospirae bacterium]|nr:threonine-phosphate decarboxylase [Nitrospirota bacterium]
MELIKGQDINNKKSRKSLCSVFCALGSDSEHGGNIYKLAKELGIPESKLIDFSASINSLGISKKVLDAIKKEFRNLVNYPDPDTNSLRNNLAQYHDIDPETIICGNGSTELIYLIPRALKPEIALIPAPTFSEYERACKLSCELRVESYELREENSFRIITDEFIAAIKKLSLNSKLIFLCNPNNPTGHLLKRTDVFRIAEAARKMKCYLVVDEAFIDFHHEESVIKHVQNNPYLIVLRSMTKFYALTGLRIGYGVFHPGLISKIKIFKEPWTVNNLAQKAAIAALEDVEYADKTFGMIGREKNFLEAGFKKTGIEYFPSDTNYYLLKIEVQHAVSLLRRKGILVRDCSNFNGLDGSYIRVAVKSRRDNEILLKEIKDVWSVIPAKAGIQGKGTGSRLKDCRNDGMK